MALSALALMAGCREESAGGAAAPDATADAMPTATADAMPAATADAMPAATVDATVDARADAATALGDVHWNPSAFLFPPVEPRQEVERSVTLENQGPRDLTVATLIGDFDTSFILTEYQDDDDQQQFVIIDLEGDNHFSPTVLRSGHRWTLVLVHEPVDDGTPSARSVRLETDAGSIELPIELDDGPLIAIDPARLDFGRVGAPASKTLVTSIANVGRQVLHIEQAFVLGDQHFQVFLGDTNVQQNTAALADPDRDGTLGLAPGARFDLTVKFSPDDDSPAMGELSIESDDPTRPDFAVGLRGNGPGQ
jgi:hypothetical protein